MAEVVETMVDGDISVLFGRSGSQVTLGWEDCCGGNGGGGESAFISERVTPQPVHPSTKCGRSLPFCQFHRSPAVPSSS